jgi:hypothetical protein
VARDIERKSLLEAEEKRHPAHPPEETFKPKISKLAAAIKPRSMEDLYKGDVQRR